MKKAFRKFSLLAILLIVMAQLGVAGGRDFYQIQIYKLSGKDQEAKIDSYLKNAYLPALHRAGIKNVGVLKPIPSDTANKNKVYIVYSLNSLDQLEKLNATLANDAVYQSSGADFLNAAWDNVPFFRKESILLKAFPGAPEISIPKHQTKPSERIYELRSYEGPTQNLFLKKVKMFNEGGEIKLFKTLDFNAVFYAEVISGPTMPNLMYLTTFSDMAAHNAHWDAFRNHPDWKKLSALEEYKHTVSKSVILLLNPTDYSDF